MLNYLYSCIFLTGFIIIIFIIVYLRMDEPNLSDRYFERLISDLDDKEATGGYADLRFACRRRLLFYETTCYVEDLYRSSVFRENMDCTSVCIDGCVRCLEIDIRDLIVAGVGVRTAVI